MLVSHCVQAMRAQIPPPGGSDVAKSRGISEELSGSVTGDAATLAAVYSTYTDVVEHVLANGFAARAGRVHVPGIRDAESRADLKHDVFVRALSAVIRNRYDSRRLFAPYLLAIARHALVDWHRKTRHELDVDDDALGDLPTDNGSYPDWSAAGLLELAEVYTAQLPPPLREIYELRFVEERSQEDAARALGISRQSLRTLERRLKDGLRQQLAADEARERSGSLL
jgi:RNA polymerase sigma factor CnrH